MIRRSSTESREAVYHQAVDQTCQLLDDPAIQDALGEHAGVLQSALDTSFLVPRFKGAISVPEDQQATQNIGVHPILLREFREPLGKAGTFLRPADRSYLADTDPEELKRINGREVTTGKWLVMGGANYFVSGNYIWLDNGRESVVVTRPTLLFKKATFQMDSYLTRGASMAHEVDHAIRQTNRFEPTETSVGPYPDKETRELRAAYDERVAYDIIAKMIAAKTKGAKDHSKLVEAIATMSPTEAGQFTRRHINKYDTGVGPEEAGTYRTALTALALTEVFSGDSPEPTADEALAYQAACLI